MRDEVFENVQHGSECGVFSPSPKSRVPPEVILVTALYSALHAEIALLLRVGSALDLDQDSKPQLRLFLERKSDIVENTKICNFFRKQIELPTFLASMALTVNHFAEYFYYLVLRAKDNG